MLRLRKPSRMVAMRGRFGVLSARRTDLRERRRCSRLRVALVLLVWCEAGEGVGGVRSGSVRWSDSGPEWGRGQSGVRVGVGLKRAQAQSRSRSQARSKARGPRPKGPTA